MSRSGYVDYDDGDFSNWDMIKYRGMVASATRGVRGQSLLRDILRGMNALKVKRLIAEDLETPDGSVCAMGAAGKVRGVDMKGLDPEDYSSVSHKLNVADCLAREVAWENDEQGPYGMEETPEERFIRMRKWVRSQINDPMIDVIWC
jgi:hypothetical protein